MQICCEDKTRFLVRCKADIDNSCGDEIKFTVRAFRVIFLAVFKPVIDDWELLIRYRPWFRRDRIT